MDYGEQGKSGERRIAGNDPGRRRFGTSERASERTLWIFRFVERSAAIYVLRAIKRTIRVRSISQGARVSVYVMTLTGTNTPRRRNRVSNMYAVALRRSLISWPIVSIDRFFTGNSINEARRYSLCYGCCINVE